MAGLYDRVRLGLLAVLLFLLVLSSVFPLVNLADFGLSFILFRHQDLPLIPLVMIFLLIRPRPLESVSHIMPQQSHRRLLAAAAVLVVLTCLAGRRWALLGLDLSRDEQMANFDALIYGRGVAVWPIEAAWRPYAEALNQMYVQPIGDHEAWVSGYLPINALARALFAKFGIIDVAGPVFILIGLVCIWHIARRVWPDDRGAPLVAVALYLGSSQILITGMTAFAMNAHVGLNLLWLLLFLRGGKAGHGGAMLVGAFATGIHQPLFHPLFVLPFLDQLRRERRWRTLWAYLLGYATIGAAWALWPLWISAHGISPIPPGAAPAGVGYIDRVLTVIDFRPQAAVLMAINLIRFITWQHLLLLPLMMLGMIAGWRRDPLARSLAIGIALPLITVTILMPYQGNGWGYRYLHGVIGSACLLATGGYVALRSHGLGIVKMMTWATAASIFLMLPIHLLMVRHHIKPFAQVDAVMRTSSADVLIVDDLLTPFGIDLVINRPDLSNRPIRLSGRMLAPSQIASLCRDHVLSFADAPQLGSINTMLGLPIPRQASGHQNVLKNAATAAGCRIRPFI